MLTKFRLLICCTAIALLGSAALVAGGAGASERQAASGTAAGKTAVGKAAVGKAAAGKAAVTGRVGHAGSVAAPSPASRARNAAAQQAVLSTLSKRKAALDKVRVPHLDRTLYAVAGLTGAGTEADGGVQIGRRGTVEVTVTGSGATAAARAIGGKVVASYAGSTVVALRPAKLRALAARPGVTRVSKTPRALPQASSEGVHSAEADAWQDQAPALGNGGTGVNVGIVDGGFKNLQAEITAGHFGPTDGSLVHYGSGQDRCDDDTLTDHGTAVAEVVHQMAPGAALYLYCVDNPVSFAQVAGDIASAGTIKVVNSSLSFAGQSRGDGSGDVGTIDQAVKAARQAGVLWIQSAGNTAEDHWTGVLRDANRNGNLDMPDPYIEVKYRTNNEVDAIALNGKSSADVVFTWDQWPRSSLPLSLLVQEYGPDNETTINEPMETSQLPGEPSLQLHLENTTTDVHFYDIWVTMDAPVPALRYDLYYIGDASPAYLAHADPGKAAAGSVTEPASSPYALAVGAADWRNNALEAFSGRGPTIDNRVKPDLVGYDGVSSNISDVEGTRFDNSTPPQPIPGSTGFYGTSAGAPHVAGAAALVAAANPDMDASAIQAFLESRANNGNSLNPPVSSVGHGLLTLGSTDASQVHPAVGSAYYTLSNPVRIVDTRTGLGVRKGPMLAGTELSVPVSTSLVPADATSVVVGVSGTAARGGTYLSVYSTSFGGTATVMLSLQEPNATVTTVVKLNSQHAFKLRNQAAQTDSLVTVIGYFGKAGASGGLGYVPLATRRLLDTRVPIGGPKGPLRPNQAVSVNATIGGAGGVPASAAVAVVNITALNHTKSGYLTAYPAASPAVTSVNYAVLSRPNLTLVPLVNGRFTLQNRFATTDAMIDVVGYFSASAASRYVALPAPTRIADTRTGNGGHPGVLKPGTAFAVDAGGLYGVPYEVSGLWMGLTAIGIVASPYHGGGYLTVYPSDTGQPHASNLDFTGSRSILNNNIATLSARTTALPPGFATSATGSAANVIEDAYGYFVTPGS